MEDTRNVHSAGGQLAGYLWQVRWALHELLDLEMQGAVSIEVEDDVCSVKRGKVTQSQLKHSLGERELTPRSVELWKTLIIWLKQITLSPAAETEFRLVTTLSVNLEGELGALVRGVGDEAREAMVLVLDRVAEEATNSALVTHHSHWLNAPRALKLALLRRVHVLPSQAALAQIDAANRERLAENGVRREHVSLVYDDVLAWFDREVAARLGTRGCSFQRQELLSTIFDIHQTMGITGLVSRFARAPTPTLADERAADPLYLRQLEWIVAYDRLQQLAVDAFHRARLERDAFMNERPTGRRLIRAYDDDLEDHWSQMHALRCAARPGDARGDAACGMQVYAECLSYRGTLGVTQPPTHVALGTFHQLAQAAQIGWHPDFKRLCEEARRST